MEKYRTLLESFEKRGKKPLALYLHIPFCARKCAYCDFLSFPSKEEQKIAYMAKLREELVWRSRDFQKGQYEVLSLFIGGGTPSAVPPEEIEKTMEVIRNCYPIYSDWEASIECNPESASKEALETYRYSGINRLSFGLQSTQEEELRFLGREHQFSTFLTAYQEARKLGFNNINIDLMNGIPLQTPESYKKTLKNISLLKPEHLSIYNLIIEKGTRFYALAKERKLPLPSEEELLEMDALTKEWTRKMGMSPYEVSNYAKEGFFPCTTTATGPMFPTWALAFTPLPIFNIGGGKTVTNCPFICPCLFWKKRIFPLSSQWKDLLKKALRRLPPLLLS